MTTCAHACNANTHRASALYHAHVRDVTLKTLATHQQRRRHHHRHSIDTASTCCSRTFGLHRGTVAPLCVLCAVSGIECALSNVHPRHVCTFFECAARIFFGKSDIDTGKIIATNKHTHRKAPQRTAATRSLMLLQRRLTHARRRISQTHATRW